MRVYSASIPDILILEPRVFRDKRGLFMEVWHEQKFHDLGLEIHFVQDNHSWSEGNVLRGLHYQINNPQGKLIRVISGEIFDVVVDIRRSSPTFGQWFGEYLSSENMKMLWTPERFAHGYYVTSDHADVIYKCSNYYTPQYERTIRWDDPDLSIDWPIPKGCNPVLSGKDATGVLLRNAEVFP